jgi:hypothetical protein
MGYFSASTPAEVLLEKLLVVPIRDQTSEHGFLPGPFVVDEEALDALIATEKDALCSKLKTMRDELKGRGLDNSVVDCGEDFGSSKEDILEALYGDYLSR